ncbi:MAG: 30S ribosomal protein S11 [Planctomycetes bacterium]|nr:30S ribosomal protein S11 [Planctomycetota bacterium]
MSEENSGAVESANSSAEPQKRVKKGKRSVPRGVAHIRSTFNNTMVAIADLQGNIIAWKSGGTMGFKGSRKGTPFAAQRAANDVAEHCKSKFGLRELDVRVQGPGPGRESAVRGLQTAGVDVKSIEDVTPLPHNGCRPRKKRRI